MSTSSFDLLRHGKTTAGSAYIGSTDVALTELGWSQMNASVEHYLATAEPWDLIVSSPLVRCADFSTKLAATLAVPLKIEADLAEYHFGAWENKTALQVMAEFPNKLEQFWQDPLQYPPANGERLEDFSRRIDAVLEKISTEYSQQKVLLVCHGGVIRYLLTREQRSAISSMLNFSVAHGELKSIEL